MLSGTIYRAINLYGVSPMLSMDGRHDSSKYYPVLTDFLLPFAADVFGEVQNWVADR